MNFLRSIIEIPVFILVIVLAAINNEFAKFSLKPFNLDISVSISVLILVLFFLGYLIGRFDGYMAGAPTRMKLREQKKAHKALNKEHEKLTNNFSHLQQNFDHLKVSVPTEPKVPFKTRLANAFKFKKD
ncbi:MAG: LapA family protein [Alphaproteobacteria bacterium]|nr:LapA family protein [Alphaproteobacteria bacterium]